MVKMKIITTIGHSNKGKTTQIKFLYDYLTKQGAFVLYYEAVGAHYEDFMAVLIWEAKMISLCSIGDYADDDEEDPQNELWHLKYIQDGIDLAKKWNSDFLINVLSLEGITE